MRVDGPDRTELEREGVIPGVDRDRGCGERRSAGPVVVELGRARLALSDAGRGYQVLTVPQRHAGGRALMDGTTSGILAARGQHRRRERRPARRGTRRPPERRQVDVPRPREPSLRRDGERGRARRSPSSVASSRAGGRDAWLVDLPGTRSLDDRAGRRRSVLDLHPAGRTRTRSWWIVDAGNLARHLPLALACRDLGLPVVRRGEPHRRGPPPRYHDRRRAPRPAAQRTDPRDLRKDRRGRRCHARRRGAPRRRSGGRSGQAGSVAARPRSLRPSTRSLPSSRVHAEATPDDCGAPLLRGSGDA